MLDDFMDSLLSIARRLLGQPPARLTARDVIALCESLIPLYDFLPPGTAKRCISAWGLRYYTVELVRAKGGVIGFTVDVVDGVAFCRLRRRRHGR